MLQFGAFIHACEVVDSTQEVARALAQAGAPPGTVVTAEYQTAGRGRQGRVWHALRGANVCMTVLCEPVPAETAWQIAPLTGVAVAEAVQTMAGVPARVRFPNDVYLNGRKLSGVLVEAEAQAGGRALPLLGIGVNGNIRTEEFPPELQSTATSLLRETGRDVVVADLTTAVLARLTELWAAWRTEGFAQAILPRWRALKDPEARRLFLLDNGSDTPTLCHVLDLAADGTVTLETAGGERRTVPGAQVILA